MTDSLAPVAEPQPHITGPIFTAGEVPTPLTTTEREVRASHAAATRNGITSGQSLPYAGDVEIALFGILRYEATCRALEAEVSALEAELAGALTDCQTLARLTTAEYEKLSTYPNDALARRDFYLRQAALTPSETNQ